MTSVASRSVILNAYTPDEVRKLNDRLLDQRLVGWDIETTGVNPAKESPVHRGRVFCHTFAWRENDNLYSAFVPCWGEYSINNDLLRGILESRRTKKVAHNGFSFDRQVVANHGIDVQGLIDTLRISKLLHSDRLWGHGLKDHMVKTLGYKEVDSFANLFSKPKVLEKILYVPKNKLDLYDTENPQHWGVDSIKRAGKSYRKLDGYKVPTYKHGEAWRIGKSREFIPLDTFIKEYPQRMPQLVDYALLDAIAALELYEVLWPQLCAVRGRGQSLGQFYDQVWSKSLYALNEMERNGIAWDSKASKITRLALERIRDQAISQVRKYTEVNLDSPKQLANYVYDELGQPIAEYCGNGGAIHPPAPGKRPVDHGALQWHRDNSDYPGLFAGILAYKVATKLHQYIVKMDAAALKGRIHCVLGPDTDTGRLSCRNPNLQQIPSKDKVGFRKCFVSSPGYSLVVCDYSQLELYILAHILLKKFKNSSLAADLVAGDVHSAVAARCWPDELSGLSAEQIRKHPRRQAAKAVIYGLNYGKGPRNLGLQLGMHWRDALNIINTIKDEYGITEFHDWQRKRAGKLGYVQTILGRRRPLPHARLFPDTDEKKRLKAADMRRALNTPIQGTAADIVTLATIKTAENKLLRSLGAKLLLQVHDELILEVPDENASEALAELIRCMENPMEDLLSVPLKADGDIGKSWGDAK